MSEKNNCLEIMTTEDTGAFLWKLYFQPRCYKLNCRLFSQCEDARSLDERGRRRVRWCLFFFFVKAFRCRQNHQHMMATHKKMPVVSHYQYELQIAALPIQS